jgi:hypothetical protein
MQSTNAPTFFDPRRPMSYFPAAWSAFSSPHRFFAALDPEGGLAPPLAFLLLTHLAPALAASAWSLAGLGAQARALAGGLAQSLLVGAMLYASARLVMKSALSLSQAMSILAYGGGVWILSPAVVWLPPTGGLILLALCMLIHLYLMLAGLQVAGKLSVPLAAACLIMAMVALGLAHALIGALPGAVAPSLAPAP